MTDEEWGPWVEHDGKGCPVVGCYVGCEVDRDIIVAMCDAKVTGPRSFEAIVRSDKGRSWWWSSGFVRILRYRVRKPKGIKVLEGLIQNLPVPTKIEEMEKT